MEAIHQRVELVAETNIKMSQDNIQLQKLDEVFLRVDSEPSVLRELLDHFTFEVPGYRFMPAYRHGVWDGKIRLFNTKNRTIYSGLVSYIKEFAQERGYEVTGYDEPDENYSVHEAVQFIESLNLPTEFTPRNYQVDTFVAAIRKKRMLMLSPTGSGKSLIIYILTRLYLSALEGKKVLIIVPTTSLVAQMSKDFEEYGVPSSIGIHQIMSGKSKDTECPIVISTWQSLFRLRKEYFEQFGMVVVDECHGVKAKSLMGILTKTPNIKYRFGTTGTLDGMQTNKLVIEGLLGPVRKVIGTKTLIDEKVLSDFMVKAIVLKHEEKVSSRLTYQEEIDYIVGNDQRNKFIKNLVLSLEGNTLVLFNYIEKHGVPLFNAIQDNITSPGKVFFVYGGTNVNDRELVRAQVEKETNAIVVASVGVYSTGINIKRLNNVVFVHPGKSRIRTLQSIGRALRRIDDTEAILYDIVDDLSCGRKTRNFAMKHYQERFAIYKSEKFKVKTYNVKLKSGKGLI